MNRREGELHTYAASLITQLGRSILVPWPVLTEVDLVLRARGEANTSIAFIGDLLGGVHRLECPNEADLSLAIALGRTYENLRLDLPDLVVMALAMNRNLPVLTWDFRHFRVVRGADGAGVRLLIEEHELLKFRRL